MDKVRDRSLLLIAAFLAFFIISFRELFAAHYLVSDLYNYWLLEQLFLSSKNPYDYQSLLAQAAHEHVGPAHFPPTVLVFLLPILAWSWETSVTVYLLSHLCLLGAYIACARQIFVPPCLPLLTLVVATVLFVPVTTTFSMGQWSLLVAFCGYTAIAAEQKQKDWLSGLLLAFATIKPHLGYLLWVAFLLTSLKNKRWKILIGGAVALLFAALISELLFPGIFSLWISSLHSALGWRSASLIMPIRLAFGTPEDPYPALPAVIIPLFMIWCTLSYFSYRKERDYFRYTPLLLILSCLSSPYIWQSDYIILLGIYFLVLGGISRKSGVTAFLELTLFFSAQLVLSLQLSSSDENIQISIYWFPLALLYLFYRTEKSFLMYQKE